MRINSSVEPNDYLEVNLENGYIYLETENTDPYSLSGVTILKFTPEEAIELGEFLKNLGKAQILKRPTN